MSKQEYENLAESKSLQREVEALFTEQHENQTNLERKIAKLFAEKKPLLLGIASFLHVIASSTTTVSFAEEKKQITLTEEQERKYGNADYRDRSRSLLRSICSQFDAQGIIAPWYISYYRSKDR